MSNFELLKAASSLVLAAEGTDRPVAEAMQVGKAFKTCCYENKVELELGYFVMMSDTMPEACVDLLSTVTSFINEPEFVHANEVRSALVNLMQLLDFSASEMRDVFQSK